MLEAEKGKFRAEAEKRVLEEKVQEVGRKLSAAQDKLREADDKQRETEMCKRLLEKEFEMKLVMEQEQLERTTSAVEALEEELGEARGCKEKMEEEVMRLREELAKK